MTKKPVLSAEEILLMSATLAHVALQKEKDSKGGLGALHPQAALEAPSDMDAPFDDRLDREWNKWGTG